MDLRLFRRRSLLRISAFAIAFLAPAVLDAVPQSASPQTPAGEIVFALDPAQSKVHWTLGTTLHTVHGTFELKKGVLHLDTGSRKASGEIVVDAISGNSGDDSRDKKMHKDVLDSAHHGEIVFRPDHVEGKLSSGGSCNVMVHGVFVLLGKEHEMTVPVQADLAADHWSGSAKFGVPFIDWGLKNPSNFLLHVDHVVEIELELKGSLQRAATP
jgi:polyisoprenoid-binding protein YceI